MTDVKVTAAAWTVAALSFAILYGGVIAELVDAWAHDDNYSHGFLIVPFALFFAWRRRDRLKAAPAAPTWAGLAVVICGLGLLVIGALGSERFLARMSMLVVLVGIVLFLRGWRTVRVLTFPLLFLLLMVPIPAVIFNKIAFPLQLLASQVGETMLSAVGVPVLREGNLIVLARTTLEVAEACSGIRSLISLLTLGIIYAQFVDARRWVRLAVSLSTVPIAIVANGVRVAGTGLAAHYYGEAAAQGFFHAFSGWLMFAIAFVLLFGVTTLLLRVLPPPAVNHSPSVLAA